MDALVEVHTEAELRRARASGARLLGVNNRDLHTFTVSLDTAVELARFAADDIVMIAESGLKTRADLEMLHELGYRGFLIGESLMRAEDPRAALRALAR
jgi:indole-3-glycerol phosphate synthase